ncbi:MAG: twin-arginine translocation signal domain-containing protein [Bacteroidales bacterium]|nr:twin-arginine translocation signal domain-containing protein [Bacteroidales bacterium]
MKRRTFLKDAAILTGAAVVAPALRASAFSTFRFRTWVRLQGGEMQQPLRLPWK